jgi:hypothetical protein
MQDAVAGVMLNPVAADIDLESINRQAGAVLKQYAGAGAANSNSIEHDVDPITVDCYACAAGNSDTRLYASWRNDGDRLRYRHRAIARGIENLNFAA